MTPCPTCPRCHPRPRPRPGLTLIEVLVSVTLTLLIVFSVVEAFDLMGDSINEGRAKIELASHMRKAYFQLQQDLDGITCPVRPSIDPSSAAGYFEYVEGPSRDRDFLSNPETSRFGDWDDVLMFTVQSAGAPFRGRGPFGPVESTMAEVVWWMAQLDINNNRQSDPQDPLVLLRRVLLIRPDLNNPNAGGHLTFGTAPTAAPVSVTEFFKNYDLSARIEYWPQTASGTPVMVANSLSDVTSRRNRFAHRAPDTQEPDLSNPQNRSHLTPTFPHQLVTILIDASHATLNDWARTVAAPQSVRAWSFLPRLVSTSDMEELVSDWVVLADVLAFDVRAFDADAPLFASGANFAIAPGDYGYPLPPPSALPAIVGKGAYVDLGYAGPTLGGDTSNLIMSQFSEDPFRPTASAMPVWDLLIGRTYDTWSLGYERDYIDQDQDYSPTAATSDNAGLDEGTNELDDVLSPNALGAGLVDDPAELETSPPYPVPLRGIEVRLRMIHPRSRQVRQVSVVGDFQRE